MIERESDAILIDRFVKGREESAFVALVHRHGPLVEGVCRRVLRNEHDIEDVFQATFLVLSRKAAAISWQESLGGWLCAVAHRLALSARDDIWRHHKRETSIGEFADVESARGGCGLPERYHPISDPWADVERRDLRRVLDHELLRLPEKYRAPVVLCDLQGRTHAQAALDLGWPTGSISRRLGRARAILRRRLSDRGITLAIGLVGLLVCLYGVWSGGRPVSRSFVSVRQTISPFKSLGDEGRGLENLLADRIQTDPASVRDSVISFAGQVEWVASQIKEHDPRSSRDEWRKYAEEMRQSARQLTQASQRDDRVAMLRAVRRLDASCQKCHDVFGDGSRNRLKTTPGHVGLRGWAEKFEFPEKSVYARLEQHQTAGSSARRSASDFSRTGRIAEIRTESAPEAPSSPFSGRFPMIRPAYLTGVLQRERTGTIDRSSSYVVYPGAESFGAFGLVGRRRVWSISLGATKILQVTETV